MTTDHLLDGKIFLAEQRGWYQDEGTRRYSSFNFQDYLNPHKAPFGQLFMLNDVCLAGRYGHEFVADQACDVITIPVTGAIELQTCAQEGQGIDVGQLCLNTLNKGDQLSILNPYQDELVAYLQIGIARDEMLGHSNRFKRGLLNFEPQNQLNPIVCDAVEKENQAFQISAGLFSGRGEATLNLKENSTLFCYVIAGAFECEGRLMHERDRLARWNTSQVECEALSNHAIMMTIELY